MPNEWTRDELILALDLYYRSDRTLIDEHDPGVAELSAFLRELPLHTGPRPKNHRSVDAVAMKISNLARFDSQQQHRTLPRGSKLDALVWDEFAHASDRLHQLADALRKNFTGTADGALDGGDGEPPPEEDEGVPEGRLLLELHKRRERSSKAVRDKKAQVLKAHGRLACEVCGFDFHEHYGPHGYGFAECHHIRPLHTLERRQKTRPSDLAIVCANCHRMLHRKSPHDPTRSATMNEIRALLRT